MITNILIFLLLSLAVIYLFLRRAINKDSIVRVENGKEVEIYVNGDLIDSYTKY